MTVKSEPRYYICLVESFVQKKNFMLKLKKMHREKLPGSCAESWTTSTAIG